VKAEGTERDTIARVPVLDQWVARILADPVGRIVAADPASATLDADSLLASIVLNQPVAVTR
jgi:hypothetical protein